MLIFKRIDDNAVETFKENILLNTKPFIFARSNRSIGLYSRIRGNVINLLDVTEVPSRGRPICMHFYGAILNFFNNRFLVGLFCPDFLYTLFTFALLFLIDEYFIVKLIAVALWFFVYISNIKRTNDIYNLLKKWLCA